MILKHNKIMDLWNLRVFSESHILKQVAEWCQEETWPSCRKLSNSITLWVSTSSSCKWLGKLNSSWIPFQLPESCKPFQRKISKQPHAEVTFLIFKYGSKIIHFEWQLDIPFITSLKRLWTMAKQFQSPEKLVDGIIPSIKIRSFQRNAMMVFHVHNTLVEHWFFWSVASSFYYITLCRSLKYVTTLGIFLPITSKF